MATIVWIVTAYLVVDRLGPVPAQGAGEAAQVRAILQQVLALVPVLPDKSTITRVLEATAIAQAQAGDVKGALQTAAAISSRDIQLYALQNVAAEQAKAGAEKTALEWISKLPAPDAKAFALLGAASGLLARLEAQKPQVAGPKRNAQ